MFGEAYPAQLKINCGMSLYLSEDRGDKLSTVEPNNVSKGNNQGEIVFNGLEELLVSFSVPLQFRLN
jgi:hypothetical protein